MKYSIIKYSLKKYSQETEKIIEQLNETWEEKLEKTEIIRRQR